MIICMLVVSVVKAFAINLYKFVSNKQKIVAC